MFGLERRFVSDIVFEGFVIVIGDHLDHGFVTISRSDPAKESITFVAHRERKRIEWKLALVVDLQILVIDIDQLFFVDRHHIVIGTHKESRIRFCWVCKSHIIGKQYPQFQSQVVHILLVLEEAYDLTIVLAFKVDLATGVVF